MFDLNIKFVFYIKRFSLPNNDIGIMKCILISYTTTSSTTLVRSRNL